MPRVGAPVTGAPAERRYPDRMLVSDSRRVLFVHVPKTGGVSVENTFLPIWPEARTKIESLRGRHPTLENILAAEPQLADYWSFGFVRNPWARMVSWYAMIDSWNRRRTNFANGIAGSRQPKRGNAMWRRAAEYSDFEEFVLRGTDELPRVNAPQISFLRATGDLQREVDFIGRTESFAADLRRVQLELGLEPVPAPHRNKSSHGRYQDYYSDAARKKVAEAFAEDIDRFEYTF